MSKENCENVSSTITELTEQIKLLEEQIAEKQRNGGEPVVKREENMSGNEKAE